VLHDPLTLDLPAGWKRTASSNGELLTAVDQHTGGYLFLYADGPYPTAAAFFADVRAITPGFYKKEYAKAKVRIQSEKLPSGQALEHCLHWCRPLDWIPLDRR
jgi:hypothetical protein